MRPHFPHDCPACEYLGSDAKHDYYYCDRTKSSGEIVVRSEQYYEARSIRMIESIHQEHPMRRPDLLGEPMYIGLGRYYVWRTLGPPRTPQAWSPPRVQAEPEPTTKPAPPERAPATTTRGAHYEPVAETADGACASCGHWSGAHWREAPHACAAIGCYCSGLSKAATGG